MKNQDLENCIKECWDCRNTCQQTLFNHCLKVGGEHVEQAHLKLMVDCMQICQLAADFMVRHSDFHQDICRACAIICQACSDSCANIDSKEMKDCAEVCRSCAESCKNMS